MELILVSVIFDIAILVAAAIWWLLLLGRTNENSESIRHLRNGFNGLEMRIIEDEKELACASSQGELASLGRRYAEDHKRLNELSRAVGNLKRRK